MILVTLRHTNMSLTLRLLKYDNDSKQDDGITYLLNSNVIQILCYFTPTHNVYEVCYHSKRHKITYCTIDNFLVIVGNTNVLQF